MTPLQITAEIIGLIVLPSALFVQSFKNIRLILIGEIALNLMVALSQFLLDGVAGAAQCLLAIVQTLLLFAVEGRSRRATIWITVLCMAVYTITGVLTYAQPFDLLPLLSSLSYSVAIMQRRPSMYRLLKNVNCTANLAYDLCIAAYALTLTHGVLLVGGILLSVRLDLLKKHAKDEATPPSSSL